MEDVVKVSTTFSPFLTVWELEDAAYPGVISGACPDPQCTADRFVSTPHDIWYRTVMFADGHGYTFNSQTVTDMRQQAGDARFLDGR